MVFGQSGSSTACGAALANGMAAHALDFDDTCYAGIAHGSATVFPAALASAQMVDASGEELLTGFLAGVETIYALGKALSETIYLKGWWTTSVLGCIGAAAGAARIFRMDERQAAHAIAISAAFAFGQRAVLGTEAKPLGAGMAAEHGLRAALLAARGCEGPLSVFEEDRGFASLFNDARFDTQRIAELGQQFALEEPGVAIKIFPACSAMQAAGQALLTILERRGARDVARVECLVTRLVAISLTYVDPKTVSEAQFSLQFGLGCLLRFGRFTIDQLRPDVLLDEGLRSCMALIEIAEGELPSVDCYGNPQPEAAELKVVFADSSVETATVGNAAGTPRHPLTDMELGEKFLACASSAVGDEQARTELGRLWGIRNLETVSGLFRT